MPGCRSLRGGSADICLDEQVYVWNSTSGAKCSDLGGLSKEAKHPMMGPEDGPWRRVLGAQEAGPGPPGSWVLVDPPLHPGNPWIVVHYGGPVLQCPGLGLDPLPFVSKLSGSLEGQVTD